MDVVTTYSPDDFIANHGGTPQSSSMFGTGIHENYSPSNHLFFLFPSLIAPNDGGFLRWGYPQSSSTRVRFSTTNHPTTGVSPFMETLIYSYKYYSEISIYMGLFMGYLLVLQIGNEGMIHFIVIFKIIPATPSNPSIPFVKRTSKVI